MFFRLAVIALGYYLAPLLGLLLWMRLIWSLRSGWLRALAIAVLIITIVSSLNSQLIPSYNVYWLALLGLAIGLPWFLPDKPQARPYHLATHALLLLLSLALHLWYCYLSEVLLFNNQFSYDAAPTLSICLLLSFFLVARQKNRWMRLAILGIAIFLGLVLGQASYLLA